MNKFYSFQSKNDNWATPQELYKILNEEFHFKDDPCPLYCELNGLIRNWISPVYINPPYSNPNEWIKQAYFRSKNHSLKIVMLLKADTSTKIFHEIILPYAKEIRFIKGRLKYGDLCKPAPFPSMIVIFGD